MNNNKKQVLIYLLIFFLGIVIALGSVYYFKDDIKGFLSFDDSNGACYTSCHDDVTITDKGISESVDKIYDAVVLVQNYNNNKLYSTGTGFVYKVNGDNGYILTNYHVVNGSSEIKIIRSDDKEVSAVYVGGDEYFDVAVLKISKKDVLKVAEIGNSTKSNLGDTVFTIGTPVDYEYRGTVTRGILSGKDRLVKVSVSSTVEDYVMKVLQTDASINPGNSGGPLVNSNGEVIGINSMKIVKSEIEGMGFAIPIEDVMEHIATFEKGKVIERPYLGISLYNASDMAYSRYYGIDISTSLDKGVVVVEIEKDSPLDGVLESGDVITKLNGNSTDTLAYLRYELFKHKVGDKVKITFVRDNKTKTVEVKLEGNK